MTTHTKITSKLQKYSKYLFLPGLCLCIVAIVARLVSGSWSLVPIGFLVAGIVVLVLWLGYLDRGFWGKRSTQAGTNALVATLAVLIILGTINFLASRYAVRVDLTENQLFTLFPQSRQVVQKLEQPLKVWVFARNPNPFDRELLENYRRYSPNFQFEFVDPQIDIGLTEKFNIQSLGEVYVEYGSKKQLVQTVNDAERLSEIKLTNVIEKVQRDRTFSIYLLQGHGEPTLEAAGGGLSQAVASLKDKGYTVEPLNLARGSQIPKNASAIAVVGPKRGLLAPEVQILKNYLNRGGRVLLMLDPDTNPNLESLLKDWGVKLDNRIVIDASGKGAVSGLGPVTILINEYGDHPITKDFRNGFSIYPQARAIDTVSAKGVTAVPLLLTDQQTWAESELGSEVSFNPAKDVQGPFNIGVALTRTSSEAEKPKSSSPNKSNQNQEKKQQQKPESRLVVFGDSDFATDAWFKQQLNQDVLINSINWLANDDEQIFSISPKEPKDRRLKLTPIQAGIINWMALLIMPLFGLIAAGVTWWRRR